MFLLNPASIQRTYTMHWKSITESREFNPPAVAGAMPQAGQSRQPLFQSVSIANLIETVLLVLLPVPYHCSYVLPLYLRRSSCCYTTYTSFLSACAVASYTYTATRSARGCAVRRGVDARAVRARQHMANRQGLQARAHGGVHDRGRAAARAAGDDRRLRPVEE
jgi:hypothetical protein